MGEWRPISEYDAAKKKPKYAVFYFPACRPAGGKYTLKEEVYDERRLGSRDCTMYYVLPAPPGQEGGEVMGENCVTAIASAKGRTYITPEDVADAMRGAPADKVRLDVLEVLSKRTGFGAEDWTLCAFVAWEGKSDG